MDWVAIISRAVFAAAAAAAGVIVFVAAVAAEVGSGANVGSGVRADSGYVVRVGTCSVGMGSSVSVHAAGIGVGVVRRERSFGTSVSLTSASTLVVRSSTAVPAASGMAARAPATAAVTLMDFILFSVMSLYLSGVYLSVCEDRKKTESNRELFRVMCTDSTVKRQVRIDTRQKIQTSQDNSVLSIHIHIQSPSSHFPRDVSLLIGPTLRKPTARIELSVRKYGGD